MSGCGERSQEGGGEGNLTEVLPLTALFTFAFYFHCGGAAATVMLLL